MDFLILFIIIFIILLLLISKSFTSTPLLPPNQWTIRDKSKKQQKNIPKASSSKIVKKKNDISSSISDITADSKDSMSEKNREVSPNIKTKSDMYFLGSPEETQLYHVFDNVYTYTDARDECTKRGAKMATPQQLKNVYEKGADWCSWGWVNDGHAYMPNKNTKCNKNIGLLSASIIDPYLRLGANCYGIPGIINKKLN